MEDARTNGVLEWEKDKRLIILYHVPITLHVPFLELLDSFVNVFIAWGFI